MKEKAKLTVAEIERLLTVEFPQMFNPQGGFAIDEVGSAVAWSANVTIRNRYVRAGRLPERP
jgi:hypothetical protein